MAISKNSTLSHSDIKSIYDSFNSFINSYGGTIAKLTVPAKYSAVDDSNVNNLNSKINEFKNDEYLKTQSSWWVNKTVTAGNLVYASDMTNINTTVSNFSKVKCRNTATNNKGTKTNGKHNKGTDSDGTCTINGTNGRGCGAHNGNNHGAWNEGCKNGSNSVTKSNGDKKNVYHSNTSTIDITYAQSTKTN